MWSMIPSDPRERQITALVTVLSCVAMYKFVFEWLPQIQVYLRNRREQRQVLNSLAEKNKDIIIIDEDSSTNTARAEKQKKACKSEPSMPNYNLRTPVACDDEPYTEPTHVTNQRPSRNLNLPNYSLKGSDPNADTTKDEPAAMSDSSKIPSNKGGVNMPNFTLQRSAGRDGEDESLPAICNPKNGPRSSSSSSSSNSSKKGRSNASLLSGTAASVDYSRPFRLNDNIAQLVEQASNLNYRQDGNGSVPAGRVAAPGNNSSHNPWEVYDNGDDLRTQAVVAAMVAEEATRVRELRQQQDAEYQASLQRDREAAKRADLEKKRVAERVGKLRLLQESVGDEPNDEDGNTVLISFRVRTMLGGEATVMSSRVNRRFLRKSTIGHMLDFVEAEELGPTNVSTAPTFELLLSHPKRIFSRNTRQDLSLTEAGLDADSLVWIEFHSD